MAKKIKRSSSASAAAPAPTFGGIQRGSNVEFNPDYTNTKKELARIGILAGSFFAILIILSFFIK